MPRTTLHSGLKGALSLLVLSTLCGCSWKEVFPPDTPTVPNADAVDRALELCALTHGSQPFHLLLHITPPARTGGRADVDAAMQAQVEVFWLNPITYRIEVRA